MPITREGCSRWLDGNGSYERHQELDERRRVAQKKVSTGKPKAMLGIRGRSRADIGTRLSACQKDIAALQKDAAMLAEGIADLAADKTSRLTNRAQGALKRFSGTVRQVPPPRPRWGGMVNGTLTTPIAIIALLIGSAAAIGSLIARR